MASRARPRTRKARRYEDGEVLVATWKRTRDGIALWLLDDESVRGEGRTLAEAEEEFEAAVIDHTRAAEVTLEFERPLPKRKPRARRAGASGGKASRAVAKPRSSWPPVVDEATLGLVASPAHVTVAGNGRAEVDNMAELFEGGLCDACGFTRGPRNERPMRVRRLQSGFAGLLAENADRLLGYWGYLFSEAFLQALTSAERRALIVREVELPRRARGAYFELLEVRPAVASAELPGVPRRGDWCRKCRRTPLLGYHVLDATRWAILPSDYVRARAVPRRASVFGLDAPPYQSFVMRQARWRELVRQGAARGIASSNVGVLK